MYTYYIVYKAWSGDYSPCSTGEGWAIITCVNKIRNSEDIDLTIKELCKKINEDKALITNWKLLSTEGENKQ